MSGKVFGFDSIEACKAYFENVLPWKIKILIDYLIEQWCTRCLV
ncbi:hypothetical protein [Anaerovorax odorimutans]|nr:hypothetical protein [Anaerovorax odorimutans]